MPSRNQLKDYVADAFYHIYNRGVGKMDIFRKKEDFVVFLYYLKIIFSPPEIIEGEIAKLLEDIDLRQRDSSFVEPRLRSKIERLRVALRQASKLQVYQNVELLSFCLMPNHFHLLVYQKVKDGIEWLMRRLASGYSSYFTREYDHRGPLYEGRYKASHLYYDPKLQAIVNGCYIERNPEGLLGRRHRQRDSSFVALNFKGIGDYPFSSLRYYLAKQQKTGSSPTWLNTKHLTDIFSRIRTSPNGILEARLAKHASYPDFVLSSDRISLEDVRLAHLESLY